MDDQEYRIADMRLKRISVCIAAVGILSIVFSIYFGFRQLAAQSKAQTKALETQWNTKFYEKKLELYARATDAAAQIAVSKSEDAKASISPEKIAAFRHLYWGAMCILEGTDVEGAMMYFNRGLTDELSAENLRDLSLYLAHVCRNEIGELYQPPDKAQSRYGNNAEILAKMRKIVEQNGVESKK